MSADLTKLAVNTIRMLAVDGVEKANSGHPGMPMGAADYSFVLWNRYLRFSASDPKWPNRDRFVLSAGHGSMLLYSLLHLAGFDMSLSDLQNFRQWGSKTPGHPECFRTAGVETTTGPLGQGAGNAVGMALAAKMMAARFNREDFSPINHFVYVVAGDGDLMEGVSGEASSLAGHLKLNNLIVVYDDNRITIDGSIDLSFSEDVAKRYEAYGWFTQRIDGHNHTEIAAAIERAQAQREKPSMILARTHIGFGAPTKVDTAKAHGAPLGKDEVEATKKALGWPLSPTFIVPDEVKKLFAQRTSELEGEKKRWEEGLIRWREKHPDLSKSWDAHWKKEAPTNLFEELTTNLPAMPDATRSTSSKIEQTLAKLVPALVGGSADLAESTKTDVHGSPLIKANSYEGRNIAFGIREHAMGAVMNGMSLYGSFIPLGSTFLIFSDYVRPSIRLSALSQLQTIYVFTHDSVFLGEDGPTHQAVEHLASLRLIPNLALVRPADSVECAAAWQIAMARKSGPTVIALTRQKLPAITRDAEFKNEETLTGGYVAWGRRFEKPDAILIATGSELALAASAAQELEKGGMKVRVVSMPCAEIFEAQPEKYRDQVLPLNVPTAAIEAGRTDYWHKFVGRSGLVIGVDRFGESAPDKVIAEKLGFTVPAATEKIKTWFSNLR
jgi:transketolase